MKTNVPGYIKDEETGAVINTNMSELEAYKQQLAQLKKQKALETKINSMESDISEIKNLLKALVNG